jgi:hypothetical protein
MLGAYRSCEQYFQITEEPDAFCEVEFKTSSGGSRSQAYDIWLMASKSEKSLEFLP